MARNGYIDNMVKQYGEDWIVALKPDDIQKATKRIVKDMVRGNLDYEKNGKYFYDPKFLENVIIAVDNELEICSLHYNALVFYQLYFPQTPFINIHINNDLILYTIYNTIYNKLLMFRQSGDLGIMVDIPSILYQYRNLL